MMSKELESIGGELSRRPLTQEDLETLRGSLRAFLVGCLPGPADGAPSREWEVVAQLEVIAEDAGRLRRDGPILGSILLNWQNNPELGSSLWSLALIRESLAQVIRKHGSGVISRTGLVSFLTNSELPEGTCSALVTLVPKDLSRFAEALEDWDLSELSRLS